MSILDFLINLAMIPPHKPELKTLISCQPEEIQRAFLQQDASPIKQQLMHNKNEWYHYERTVAQI
ncbi:MAG: hypothetical protein KIT56_01240 [Gammaproteobacteria bacterium]|nr:hypothetical protein [Gammaproteobacteria bacterium]MCW5582509.1 hypothetical protein [Gammaproteobacteria bacterium]